MEHIGVDVHKMQSQICILSDDGEVIELNRPGFIGDSVT